MTQVYTKSEKKQSTKFEKNQEKESLDKKFDPRIVRSPHDRENPYVMVNKSLLYDNGISPTCRFLLMFLLAKPNDWDINTSSLKKELSPWIGREKILDLYKEAIKAGYMKRVDIFEKGRRIDCIYYVSESPIYRDDSNNIARESAKRTCEKPTVVLSNETYTKEIYLEKEVVKKKTDRPKPPPNVSPSATTSVPQKKEKPPKKSLRRPITDLEKQSLYAKYPKLIVDEKLKNIEAAMKEWPKAYVNKDPYREVALWCEEEMAKKAKTFSKGAKKVENIEQNAAYDKLEQRAKDEENLIRKFIEDNKDLQLHMKLSPSKKCVELRNTINPKRFDMVIYPDPYLKSKLDTWASEYRKTHRIASS